MSGLDADVLSVGLDGARAGWVAVHLRREGPADVTVHGALDDLPVASDVVLAVDMPIGAVDGRRDADVAARAALPGRASSVFGAPPRSVLDAVARGEVSDHAAASALARRQAGLGLTQQAWRLVPRILELERLAAARPAVLEVHPELAYAVVLGAPAPPKRTWAGRQVRAETLRRLGVRLPARFVGDDRVATDDVLDAAICAWVAAAPSDERCSFPAEPVQRDGGRPIAIHARVPPLAG
jgi:predicted RNase H-like nuclease